MELYELHKMYVEWALKCGKIEALISTLTKTIFQSSNFVPIKVTFKVTN